MNSLINFLKDFFKNKGLFVFSAFIVEKLVMLINTIFIVKMISQEEFGRVTLIASVLAFFIPLSGFGTFSMFLKFGSEQKTEEEKLQLSQEIFRKGLRNQFILAVGFIIISNLYSLKFEHLGWIIAMFTIRLIGVFLQSHLTIFFRINGQNQKFATVNILVNLIGLALTFMLTFYFGVFGYMISLAISPFISLFFYTKNLFLLTRNTVQTLDWKKMWRYGWVESVAYFASELLFSIDIAMIALFMTDKDISLYKVAIILPLNLLFIPSMLFQTDMPRIIQNSTNKTFLKQYIFNYYRLFIPLSIIILVGSFFLKEWLIKLFFNSDYSGGNITFFIATLAVVAAMLTRVIFINLNSAIGKANWNIRISILSIILLVIFDLLLIPKYGIEGAATGLMLTFTTIGLYSAYLFKTYLNALKTNE
ncbi:oligosaccharide flippase family protein [Faecalibacter bovis]|uniref:Oligosaccharide flippase family protein n=1 Tax=Faecalibacter bovis TaxID=2898187 RepID=A0ABX7XFT3_9FLAO|nr:oligosaccharide flippase family protein [Faecalibacter bovis]QTV06454.1 oligosaccharide flippase family protein [Faecalibacter bovis]